MVSIVSRRLMVCALVIFIISGLTAKPSLAAVPSGQADVERAVKTNKPMILRFHKAAKPMLAASPAEQAKLDRTVKDNNQFALDFYNAVAKTQKGNLFFSPYSLSSALAMTYAGAKGRTAGEMARTLYFDRTDKLHAAFCLLTRRLNSINGSAGNKISVANALWTQTKLLKDYLALVKNNYDGEARSVDFGDPEAARKIINDWVSTQTQKLIPELIPSGILNKWTRLVLTNAIYFKGEWENTFQEKRTRKMPFQPMAGQSIEVPTMNQLGKFRYVGDSSVQALELPYSGGDLSMVVLLPNEKDGVNKITWTADQIDQLIAKMEPSKIDVFLPKFKMRSRFELSAVLKGMGMPTAFTGAADFSGMTGRPELYIGYVLHQAFIDVDEKGTTAAAATAVGMILKSAPPRHPIFRADHPFVFLIRDRKTGSILFMGRVNNPLDSGK